MRHVAFVNMVLDVTMVELGQAVWILVPKVSGFGALNGHYERSQVTRGGCAVKQGGTGRGGKACRGRGELVYLFVSPSRKLYVMPTQIYYLWYLHT